jgi:peroxiredoxin/glutaredoxin
MTPRNAVAAPAAVRDDARSPCDDGTAARLCGQRVPFTRFRMRRAAQTVDATTDDLFGAATVVAFGLPGAFTPTCSSSHVPRFVELAPLLREHGVERVLCLSVNDAFVMEAWQRDQGAECITFVPDGNGDFHRALGLLADHRDDGMGLRARRYAMLVRDGTIDFALVEPDESGDPYGISSADSVLERLAPDHAPVQDIVVFTRPLCSHSERAKRLLDERGVRYDAVDLKPRGVIAVSGETSTPQVFVNGRLIGGCDALERWLDGSTTQAR